MDELGGEVGFRNGLCAGGVRGPANQCGAGVEGGDGVRAVGKGGRVLGLGGRCFHLFTVTRVTVPFPTPPEARDMASRGLPSSLPSRTRDQTAFETARDSSRDRAMARYHNRTARWQGQEQDDALAHICWHLRHGANIRTARWQDHALAACWQDKDSTDTWQTILAPAHLMRWQDHDEAG
jgi:hypothetical protein